MLTSQEDLLARAEDAEHKMSNLLKLIGNPGQCGSERRPGCGAGIWWIQTKAGKAMPINSDGTPHWATCPNSLNFKREKNIERRG